MEGEIRNVVIVRLCGGLGNQMFQYACGRALALRNQAGLKLDLTRYADPSYAEKRPYLLDRLRVEAGKAGSLEVRFAHGGRMSRTVTAVAPCLKFRFFEENGLQFHPEVASARGNVYLSGFWQCERYFADAADAIRRELQPRAEPEGENLRLLREIEGGASVSVHVRRTDFFTDPIVYVCSLDYYMRAAEEIARRERSPRYYVFSDDPDWTRENLKLPQATYIGHNGNAHPEEDLRLMSRCRHHIVANSTFSWWGAWLCENPGKVVIAPKRWYEAEELNVSEIVPPDWIRLAARAGS